MKIIITGASSFVGQQIIPTLIEDGAQLLLISRQPRDLSKQYPNIEVKSYENLTESAAGYDALLHLAVLNNNNDETLENYRKVNVYLLKHVAESAVKAKINTFINLATLHAKTQGNDTPYAVTKREGQNYLKTVKKINVVNLQLPAVYGDSYRGKLSILNRVPRFTRSFAFQVLAAIKPTVHVNKVAYAIIEASKTEGSYNKIVSDQQNNNYVYKTCTRAIDIVFALFVIFFLWWALLITWIIVHVSSDGPAIFSQERVGRRQRIFKCYKFRTMYSGTKSSGTHELNASVITKVGSFLRKTKIDELPQVINILKNELSLIGPRPGLPTQTCLLEARQKRGVFNVNGGITGLAQIQGIDMSDPEKLAVVDEEYINLRSLSLDIKIIVATAIGGGQGDKINKGSI